MRDKPNVGAVVFKWGTFCLLLILAAIQFYYLWQDYAKNMWPNVFNYISTVQRSEIMVVGVDDARFLRFLDLYLPKSTTIVGVPIRQFASQNRMQWFLLPRNTSVSACRNGMTDACRQLITDPNTAVPAIGDFPGVQQIPGKVFIPYTLHSQDIHGVYVAESLASSLKVPEPKQVKNPPVRSPRLLLLDLLVLGLLFVLGALLLSLIHGTPGWIDYISLSLPLAFAVLTWIIFFTSWLGIPITRVSVGLYLGLLIALGVLGNRLWNHRWLWLPPARLNVGLSQVRRSLPALLLGLLLLVLFGLAAGIAIGRSYSAFDEYANWGLKGYAMAEFGTIRAGATFGGHVLSYPMNIPLSIALFRLADGDLIPGSKLIFPIMAAGLLLQIYAFLRRHGVSAALVLVAGLFLFTVPDLFTHSTMAFANLPFTAYLVVAALWTMDGLLENRWRWVLLGGVLFACGAWTRPEGIGFSLIILIGIYLFHFLRRRTLPPRRYLLCSFGAMLFPISWVALLGSQNMSGDQIGQVLSLFQAGGAKAIFNPVAAYRILRYAVQYFSAPRAGAGFLLPAGLLILLIGLLIWRRRRDERFELSLFLTGLAALVPAALFYIAAPREAAFGSFLAQSFNRAYFPAFVLLIVTTMLLFAPPEPEPSPG